MQLAIQICPQFNRTSFPQLIGNQIFYWVLKKVQTFCLSHIISSGHIELEYVFSFSIIFNGRSKSSILNMMENQKKKKKIVSLTIK